MTQGNTFWRGRFRYGRSIPGGAVKGVGVDFDMQDECSV